MYHRAQDVSNSSISGFEFLVELERPFLNRLSCKPLQGGKESDTNPFGPEVEAQYQYKANSENVDCGELDSSGLVYPPSFEDFCGVAGPSS